ncbi:hypothetical protein T440DRAFT_496292 [Plenodomus tracheiphilus IPT5]|uniref:Uncharacterized protein n=1 Tax=Plenodomus tracheiphilus IPT5 TaxID=1408161 RepID=A0A6A7BF35_9PLEO|nr:hypothetical protein T440DRAFT_496292 [Plenodomus tracheiphilus IPT5]
MPLCTLHLLALHPTSPNPLATFLSALKSSSLSPLVISRVIRWIILPTKISTEHLLARNIHWDILLILPNTDALPLPLKTHIGHHWHITAGIPSRLIQDFATKNRKLLHPEPSSIPPLNTETKVTTDSAQSLELSSELNTWIEESLQRGGKEDVGAVSMFNLLSFNPGMKASYLQYGAAFAESIGSAHGGNAKIVGNVVDTNGCASPPKILEPTTPHGEVGGSECWDEIALAHYPSISHFRDMLTSEGYQRVNKRYRVPSLRDTAILMTSEVEVEEMMRGGGGGGPSKL